MTAVAHTGEHLLNQLPPELRLAVLAAANAVVSDPIKDKRYLTLSRSGEAVAEFLTWYKATGAAPTTVDEYERALARMCMYLPDVALDDWDAGMLLKFVTDYPGRWGMAPESLRTKVYAPLKKFWWWATAWKRLPWNPMELLPKPKQGSPRIYEIFDDAERAKILLAADRSLLPKRDKAAVLLFFDTGARKTDVRLLQWRDVNTADRYLIYRHRKGAKQDVIQFGLTLQAALLDAYHSEYPIVAHDETKQRNPDPDDYVCFPNGVNGGSFMRKLPSWIRPRQPMAESTMQRWWKDRLLPEAGVKHRRLHMTRHTHGTEMLEATGDIEAVKTRLGHASLSSTEIYVHNSRRRGRAAVDAYEAYRQVLSEKELP